jgi:lon-related putative ATP-dependent protease
MLVHGRGTMSGTSVRRLDAAEARWTCSLLSFELTPDSVPEALQERAIEAMRFGAQLGFDFHLLAVGPEAVGIEIYLDWLLDAAARAMPPCCDWCYVTNFENPNAPQAVRLPAGQGRIFKAAVESAIYDLRLDIPRAFEAEPYEHQRDAIIEGFSRQRDNAFATLQQRAAELNFGLVQTPQGITIVPLQAGQPIAPEDFAQLEPEARARFDESRGALGADLDQTMRAIRDLEYQVRQALRQLDEGIASAVVEQRFRSIEETYAEYPVIVGYLTAAKADIVANIPLFRGLTPDGQPPSNPGQALIALEEFLRHYTVNVVVDHSGEEEFAVVLTEENPTYGNLIGKIERRNVFGTLVTDFTMIKPGALLRANGGYLVLQLRDILAQPVAWEALKHALLQHSVKIEEMGQVMGVMATTSLEPEPIPLEAKIVLVGDSDLVQMISMLDPEFQRLFKIRCEFHTMVERTPEQVQALASFLVAQQAEDDIPLARSGAARLIEHAARVADDQRKLSAALLPLADLVHEARQVAASAGHSEVDAEAVREAIALRRRRSEYLAERLQELMVEGTVIVDTSGAEIGNINGLQVLQTGDFSFGKPVRISARAYPGRGGIVDIDREVELGGKIHSKGVLILSGYFNGRYGQHAPLSLSASIVFEQSYSQVEGDSASLAELCALVSSLAELPLRQDLAITGSVNQYGEVQAIGGINEKIEGFFDLCVARGLTGAQGIAFPASNVPNLMLREDVIAAVAAGQFALYPVANVDEALELFTAVPAGVADEQGVYPEGTIHARVAARLKHFGEVARPYLVEQNDQRQPDS